MTKEMWTMPKKRFSSEEIIHKLREAEVLSSQGRTVTPSPAGRRNWKQ
jgi:hypothetical protein